MPKAKKHTVQANPAPKTSPNPLAGFSKFGKNPQFGVGGQKFSPKGITTRPTFITQHKGGGGK